tara:strand:+ start:245 stop:436 length:192 start_codon:yes stop_codon:yes gene_type:complete
MFFCVKYNTIGALINLLKKYVQSMASDTLHREVPTPEIGFLEKFGQTIRYRPSRINKAVIHEE